MKKMLPIILAVIFSLNAQALFEVKDASENTVLEVSQDGLRIFNMGDTLMVISSTEIKAFIDESAKDKALSRSFSITTSTSAEKLAGTDVFEVGTESTMMREGTDGNRYTDFSEENIFLGLNAGENTLANLVSWRGVYNISIGNKSGFSNETGICNVFIGEQAGYTSVSRNYNTMIGYYAGRNATGTQNTFIGNGCGWESTSGGYNSFFGDGAGSSNGEGSHNSIFGNHAGRHNSNGSYNSIFGSEAGLGSDGLSNYNYNCLFGYHSGRSLTTGSNNVMIGHYSGGANQIGSGNVFIGEQAGYNETGSNRLYIDNSNTIVPLIYGEFDNNLVKINGENLWVNNIEASTTNLTIDGDDGYIKQLRFFEEGAYKAGFGWSGANDYIFLYEGSTNSFSSKGGKIGIRTVDPQTYLHVGIAGEVNATEGGGFILGPTISSNLSMDENEIQARNGTSTASLFLNNYGGDVYVGGTLLGSSDLRLKKDIANVSYGLKDVLKMRSVSFNWKNTKNQHKSMGFIAQELETIFPELVFDDEKGMKSVNYDGIIPILVNSIKEQQSQIDQLIKQIENLVSKEK